MKIEDRIKELEKKIADVIIQKEVIKYEKLRSM